jgi:hypothetical protein
LSPGLALEQPGIRRLIVELLARLERNPEREREPMQLLSGKHMPEFGPERRSGEGEAAWAALRSLEEAGFIRIDLPKLAPGKAPFQLGPRVRLVVEAEEQLRSLARVPRKGPSAQQLWREAVQEVFAGDAARIQAISQRLIGILGRTPVEVLYRLKLLRDQPFPDDTLLRSVSAKLFWGDSKVLDDRSDLVSGILGRHCPYAETPIQLDVQLTHEYFDEVLMVENPAAFMVACRAMRRRPIAVLCTHGFKASASRVRKIHGCKPFFSRQDSASLKTEERFENWLFHAQASDAVVWFWGDLDWEGLNILQSIREAFPGARAWKPGYKPMVKLLEEGFGHLPAQAGKEGQREVAATGCEYADTVLRDVIKTTGRYLDQEVVLLSDLQHP